MRIRKIGSILALSLLAFGTMAAPPTVTVTVTPASGPAPLNAVLSWTTTGATECFRGLEPVPLNGSVNHTGIVVDTQYTITCRSGKDYTDITWTAPTEMITGVDGSGNCTYAPVPATGPDALAGFRLVYNTSLAALQVPPKTPCGGPAGPQPVGTVVDIPDPAARSYRVINQPNSDYFYLLAAYNQQGQFSDFTGPVTNKVEALTAMATATLNVESFSTYETAVYNVVKKNDGFVMVVVGSVPLNTLCIRTQTVNGYYAVPVSKVTSWTGTVRPIVVVAKCKDQ
jgi:hypothetical protein